MKIKCDDLVKGLNDDVCAGSIFHRDKNAKEPYCEVLSGSLINCSGKCCYFCFKKCAYNDDISSEDRLKVLANFYKIKIKS